LEGEGKLGAAWYHGFLSHHQSLLTRNCDQGYKEKDLGKKGCRRTFMQQKVEAGVAEELTKPIQYEDGLPTKYKLIHPEYVLFVDETG
jgi:hypothetical protein